MAGPKMNQSYCVAGLKVNQCYCTGVTALQVDYYNRLSTVRIDTMLHAVCIRNVSLTVPAAATCIICDTSAVGILQATCYGLLLPEPTLPVHQHSLCA